MEKLSHMVETLEIRSLNGSVKPHQVIGMIWKHFLNYSAPGQEVRFPFQTYFSLWPPNFNKSPSTTLNRNLSATIYGHLDFLNENANDPIIPKFQTQPWQALAAKKSPTLPARQKTSPENLTGYGRVHFRRERGEYETRIERD
ncbi:MAG: hypothetical protein AUJ07_10965 [Crenarchaeota archaeon 13_1_40CM_3_53_5]|nr:MAG: hypothetical protein AUJ07_10965 [Crenarchaeota archaeon 13_1_40CM_3_53_5]